MIVLDTHIWIWWIHDEIRLSRSHLRHIQANEAEGLGISVISCWEVAKLVEKGRLTLPRSLNEWLDHALAYPGIRLLDLTPRIAVESTQLPGGFHANPADQIIVATARVHGYPLVTADTKITAYPHVRVLT